MQVRLTDQEVKAIRLSAKLRYERSPKGKADWVRYLAVTEIARRGHKLTLSSSEN